MKKKSRWALGALSALVCAAAWAGPDPFEKARVGVAPVVSASALAQDPAPVAPKPIPGHVLCGIRQSVDSAALCVDGQWMDLARFEKKFKKSVVAIGALSVRLKPGGVYAIGDELAKGRARSASQGEAR